MSQTVCRQEQIGVSAQDGQKVAVLLNYKTIRTNESLVANTLMARDWKGLGSGFELSNGVLEEVES